jgi:antirestriction protein ArdC
MRRRLSGAPAVPFLKSYIVFNVEQIAGLPEHYYAKPGAKRPEPQRIEHAALKRPGR